MMNLNKTLLISTLLITNTELRFLFLFLEMGQFTHFWVCPISYFLFLFYFFSTTNAQSTRTTQVNGKIISSPVRLLSQHQSAKAYQITRVNKIIII